MSFVHALTNVEVFRVYLTAIQGVTGRTGDQVDGAQSPGGVQKLGRRRLRICRMVLVIVLPGQKQAGLFK